LEGKAKIVEKPVEVPEKRAAQPEGREEFYRDKGRGEDRERLRRSRPRRRPHKKKGPEGAAHDDHE
jgi:hypothetical protein